MVSPKVVLLLRALAAGRFTNRDSGKKSIIQSVTVGRAQVFRRVIRRRAMIVPEKALEAAGSWIGFGPERRDRSQACHWDIRGGSGAQYQAGGHSAETARPEGSEHNPFLRRPQ